MALDPGPGLGSRGDEPLLELLIGAGGARQVMRVEDWHIAGTEIEVIVVVVVVMVVVVAVGVLNTQV